MNEWNRYQRTRDGGQLLLGRPSDTRVKNDDRSRDGVRRLHLEVFEIAHVLLLQHCKATRDALEASQLVKDAVDQQRKLLVVA